MARIPGYGGFWLSSGGANWRSPGVSQMTFFGRAVCLAVGLCAIPLAALGDTADKDQTSVALLSSLAAGALVDCSSSECRAQLPSLYRTAVRAKGYKAVNCDQLAIQSGPMLENAPFDMRYHPLKTSATPIKFSGKLDDVTDNSLVIYGPDGNIIVTRDLHTNVINQDAIAIGSPVNGYGVTIDSRKVTLVDGQSTTVPVIAALCLSPAVHLDAVALGNKIDKLPSTNSGEAIQGARARWHAAILKSVKGNWSFPIQISEDRVTRFQINATADGRVINSRIIKSSGNPAVDDSLLRAVQKSSPLPGPYKRGAFESPVTIEFTPPDNFAITE